jgi:hypothetical protein
MRAFQRYSVLLLVAVVLIVSVGLVYLSIADNAAKQQANNSRTTTPTGSETASGVQNTPITPQVTATPKPPCDSKQRSFQMGIAFPDWGTTSYGPSDTKWLTELPVMQAETSACWVEMPILLHQESLTSTVVMQGPATAELSSFDYGVRFAHSLGLHVFVTMQLQSAGSEPWSALINFSTYAQEQQWFQSYWQVVKPYAMIAEQDGVEQFALGTEYRWLEQNAPASLWNGLIGELSNVYTGALTYDMDWSALHYSPPSWMRNPHLKMIGISSYSPLVDTPVRVDPKQIPALWAQTAQRDLDNFSIALGRPIFLSEVGFPNCQLALYQPWNSHCTAPLDPQEQAAATGAALANAIHDQRILGSFFWGWDNVLDFNLYAVQATKVIQSYYKSLQA